MGRHGWVNKMAFYIPALPDIPREKPWYEKTNKKPVQKVTQTPKLVKLPAPPPPAQPLSNDIQEYLARQLAKENSIPEAPTVNPVENLTAAIAKNAELSASKPGYTQFKYDAPALESPKLELPEPYVEQPMNKWAAGLAILAGLSSPQVGTSAINTLQKLNQQDNQIQLDRSRRISDMIKERYNAALSAYDNAQQMETRKYQVARQQYEDNQRQIEAQRGDIDKQSAMNIDQAQMIDNLNVKQAVNAAEERRLALERKQQDVKDEAARVARLYEQLTDNQPVELRSAMKPVFDKYYQGYLNERELRAALPILRNSYDEDLAMKQRQIDAAAEYRAAQQQIARERAAASNQIAHERTAIAAGNLQERKNARQDRKNGKQSNGWGPPGNTWNTPVAAPAAKPAAKPVSKPAVKKAPASGGVTHSRPKGPVKMLN